MAKNEKVGAGTDEELKKPGKEPEGEERVSALEQKVDTLAIGVSDLVELIKQEREDRKALDAKVETLADRARLQMWDEKNKDAKDMKRKYRLSTFNGKVVVGWSALKSNVIYQMENKMWLERQTTELVYEDNSKEEVDYKKWQIEQKFLDVIYDGEELAADGTRILNLVAQDGRKFKLDVKFVN